MSKTAEPKDYASTKNSTLINSKWQWNILHSFICLQVQYHLPYTHPAHRSGDQT